MIAVFADGDAQVIAGLLALIGVLAGLWAQTVKTHRENRADHSVVSGKVDQLLAAQGEIRSDVTEIRDDLREVRADVRDHGERLRRLEVVGSPKPAARASTRKKAAS